MPTPKGAATWNKGTAKGWLTKQGYRVIRVFEDGRWRQKRMNRYVMEQHLGRRLLPEEVVHHKDGDPLNNEISNLEILNWGEHAQEHHIGKQRADAAKLTIKMFAQFRHENLRLRKNNAELAELVERIADAHESGRAISGTHLGAEARALLARIRAAETGKEPE
jgi:hypothetical protein